MKPIVKVIAHTKFLGVPLELQDKGIKSNQDQGSDLARLIETAGRTCYDSFGAGRSSEEYHKHLLEVGHGCYDEETEVLTDSGWKKFKDTNQLDKFATLSKEGIVGYYPATSFFKYYHEGRMFRVDSQRVDLLTTPNHNMYVCMMTTREGRKKNNFDFIKAEDIGTRSHCYTKIGKWEGGRDFDISIAALLGFAIGDGYLGEKGRRLSFHLRKERKIEYLFALSEELEWEFWHDEDDWYYFRIPDEYIGIFKEMYGTGRAKQIPQYFLTSMCREAQEALLDGLINSDGHIDIQSGSISYDTTSQVLVGQIQQLCLHVGLSADICYTIDKSIDPTSFGNKPLIRVSIIQRANKPEVNRWSGAAGKSYWIDNWKGTVYCVEVPHNTLYVRRNGKVVWCGNSCLEHSTISFFISNVSRGLTHELVRHRAGVAISQRSTRYVDESESEWVYHPLLEECILDGTYNVLDTEKYREAHELQDHLNCVISECKRLYDTIVSNITFFLTTKGVDKLTARKQARGAARGMLGNALSTELIWTANIRALRHFIEMRASEYADAEIRILANCIFEESYKVCPEYFFDYERVDCPDGVGYGLFTKNRKV